MEKPEFHFLVCCSFRVSGEPKGICHKKESVNLLQFLENEILDRGMDNAVISSTGCLKICQQGPVLIVYPHGYWYAGVDEDAIDEILDALEEGNSVEKYLLKEGQG